MYASRRDPNEFVKLLGYGEAVVTRLVMLQSLDRERWVWERRPDRRNVRYGLVGRSWVAVARSTDRGSRGYAMLCILMVSRDEEAMYGPEVNLMQLSAFQETT